MYDRKEAEGTKRRHQVDTVVEGMCVSSFVLLLIGSFKLPFSFVSCSILVQRDQSHDEQYRFGAARHR